tara:strand:- start:7677 stop:8006 length:330 start_codon:yes stop_codon:yes gene_type:complete
VGVFFGEALVDIVFGEALVDIVFGETLVDVVFGEALVVFFGDVLVFFGDVLVVFFDEAIARQDGHSCRLFDPVAFPGQRRVFFIPVQRAISLCYVVIYYSIVNIKISMI